MLARRSLSSGRVDEGGLSVPGLSDDLAAGLLGWNVWNASSERAASLFAAQPLELRRGVRHQVAARADVAALGPCCEQKRHRKKEDILCLLQLRKYTGILGNAV